MTTIKSYTDVAQSKTLSNILPFESADGTWVEMIEKTTLEVKYRHSEIPFWLYSAPGLPSWSIAALLDILPMIGKGEDTANPFIAKAPNGEYYIVYATLTEEVYNSSMYDNPVDACYEMIIRLNELNLL